MQSAHEESKERLEMKKINRSVIEILNTLRSLSGKFSEINSGVRDSIELSTKEYKLGLFINTFVEFTLPKYLKSFEITPNGITVEVIESPTSVVLYADGLSFECPGHKITHISLDKISTYDLIYLAILDTITEGELMRKLLEKVAEEEERIKNKLEFLKDVTELLESVFKRNRLF